MAELIMSLHAIIAMMLAVTMILVVQNYNLKRRGVEQILMCVTYLLR